MGLYDSFQLTDSNYIPQYTGLPLAAIESVGDELQNRHYENIARARQLELLGMQQKANAESEADKLYIDGQLQGVQQALGEMAKTGAENATSRIAALANRFVGDEGLINIQKSIDARNRERALTEQLQAQGKSPVLNQAALDQFVQRGTFDPETGKWSPYTPTVQERLDYMGAQDKVVDPLQADLYQTDLVGDMKTTLQQLGINVPSGDISKIPAYLKTTIAKRLSQAKIDNFIDNKGGWKNYQSTAEYKQQRDILGLSDAEIKEQLRARGSARVFEQIQKDWERNPALGLLDGAGGKQDAIIPPTGEQMANTPVEVNDPVGDITHFIPSEREGFAEFGSSSGFAAGSGPGPSVSGSRGEKYYGPARGVPEKRWKALSEYATTGAEVFGEGGDKYKNLNEKSDPKLLAEAAQYAKQYQDLVTKRQVFTIKDVTNTKREAEEGRSNAADITTDVQNNIRNRAIYDPVTKKLVPIISKDGESYSDDFIDIIGSPKNINITGSLDPQNYLAKQLKNDEFADAYVANIEDPNDPSRTREVYITRRKYDPSQNRWTAYNRITNKIYSEVNAEPGKSKSLDLYGKKVNAQELVGNQLTKTLKEMSPEDQQIIMSYEMPILAEIPGQGVQIFNGPKHLADYLLNNK